METILFVSAAALICMCVLGYIVGSFFSQGFDGGTVRPEKAVEQPRVRTIGVIYPARRSVALQRAA